MANCITLGRLVLLFGLVFLTYSTSLAAQIAALLLLIIIFIMDGLDGWVARKKNQCSLFGSVFDIAADRVVENVLWVILTDLDRVPLWVTLTFLLRGFLVDAIRSVATQQGKSAYSSLRLPLAEFLVASRFMRGLYGTVKTTTFAWLYLLPILYSAWPQVSQFEMQTSILTDVLVIVTVALCLLRGIPVVVEFAISEGAWAGFGPSTPLRPKIFHSRASADNAAQDEQLT